MHFSKRGTGIDSLNGKETALRNNSPEHMLFIYIRKMLSLAYLLLTYYPQWMPIRL